MVKFHLIHIYLSQKIFKKLIKLKMDKVEFSRDNWQHKQIVAINCLK